MTHRLSLFVLVMTATAAEDLGTIAQGGAVHVLYGLSGDGLSAAGSQFWNQDSPGILDDAEPGDEFGRALY